MTRVLFGCTPRFHATWLRSLLVVGLLLGLWSGAQHGADHVASEAHAETCAICVLSHAGTGGLARAMPVLQFFAALAPRAISGRVLLERRIATRVRVRGPPSLLV